MSVYGDTDKIDEIISTTSATSRSVRGVQLARTGVKAQNATIALQIVPEAESEYEVHLESRLPSDSADVPFTSIGEYTQGDVRMSTLQVALATEYRFKHISGTGCRVILRG